MSFDNGLFAGRPQLRGGTECQHPITEVLLTRLSRGRRLATAAVPYVVSRAVREPIGGHALQYFFELALLLVACLAVVFAVRLGNPSRGDD